MIQVARVDSAVAVKERLERFGRDVLAEAMNRPAQITNSKKPRSDQSVRRSASTPSIVAIARWVSVCPNPALIPKKSAIGRNSL